ncbi:hypothetical protein SeMB42_g01542 [Synchytrium endobioticum]|uniref:Uncharacterized protein n=1 Tax=Synchytrium endobioticum TaxID=286115 RepID=A0A507DN13_9FUNG|nr:hypothetical protein SeLEV6574_g04407 [Synchytrium endobioticum]TPX52270.1 hypothetical protein SeMB42_g01542 [Synchytrium endobioticum]
MHSLADKPTLHKSRDKALFLLTYLLYYSSQHLEGRLRCPSSALLRVDRHQTMADLEALRDRYEAFCAFGSSRNLAGAATSIDIGGHQMDNAKFAKFTKDTGIVDKRVTIIDVDIIFNKVKAKGARKLDWETFQDALAHLAEKKYPSLQPEQGFNKLVSDVLASSGPSLTGTAVSKNAAIVDRLTDASTFPVTHKNRFEEHGVLKSSPFGASREGLGKSNGTTPTKSPATVKLGVSGNKRGVTESTEKLDMSKNPVKSNKNMGSMDMASLSASKSKSGSVGSVYDRLTDHKSYTGTHKLRFNDDGSGRGIAGRDSPSKGGTGVVRDGQNVNDLSQILRR